MWIGASAGAADCIYVSSRGDDAANGSRKRPVASLSRAVDLARVAKFHRIEVGAGEYRLEASLVLDTRDSQLTIEALPGTRPLITGAAIVPATAISETTDGALRQRAQALSPNAEAFNLDVAEIPHATLAPYVPYGFPRPIAPGPSELFADSEPMTLARWPNSGFTKVKSVRESGNGEADRDRPPRMPIFTAESDRAKTWKSIDNAWLCGYWKYDWADETIKLHSVDPSTGEITLETPYTYGIRPGAPFFVENLLEELDAVGEYYSDPPHQSVQFVQDKGRHVTYRLSLLGSPLLSLNHVDHVTVRGLDFAYSRGDAADLEGCGNTRFEACQFYDLGERAVVISNGHDSGLAGCNIWNTAHGGVVLNGGDRKTLSPARLYVENCDIHDYQRKAMTYRPGVSVSGVGNRVSHCAIHDAPHSAIIFGGNDHVFEFNEFYRTVSRTGDGGVVYAGRDWTARGTVIRSNYFHDNVGLHQWEPAIYFDDQISGLSAIGNVIERCHWGFLIGGGRDNVIADNQIIDCKLGMHCDARGLGWAGKSKPTMMANLRAVPYLGDVWRARYPTLAHILDGDPMMPAGNIVRDNSLIRSGTLLKDTEEAFRKTTLYEGNLETDKGSRRSTARMGLVLDRVRKLLPRG